MKRFSRFCLVIAVVPVSLCSADAQGWFFNWDGTTDITCVPTTEGNNAFYQGAAANSTFYWEIVDNDGGGKAVREVVTGNTGFRWYGYGSRPEYYRGPCTTFAMENFRADHNAFTITFRIKAETCSSTSNVRFFNCEFETPVLNPFWPSGGAYEPYYTFRVEFALRKGAGNDIWLYDNRLGKDLYQLKANNAQPVWHTVWGTCELPPYPYTTTNCTYRLWVDGTEVAWDDRDRGGWSDCEVGWTPTSSAYATFALDYLCYTYGAYQPGVIAIPAERVVAPTNSLAALKACADGTPCALTNKVVAGIFTDPRLGVKFYYVSEADGSEGIKVRHNTGKSPVNTGGSTVTLAVGDVVSIKGGLNSAEGEKQISAHEIIQSSTGSFTAAPLTVIPVDLLKSFNSTLFTGTPSQLLPSPETGVVSSVVGTNRITDTAKNWTTNQWKNLTVFLPATVNHSNLCYYVLANTSNTLTIAHRTIRPDFNVAPNIVADGVRAGDGYEFAGGNPTGPRLDGRFVRITGTVMATNGAAGYFDLSDGSVSGEVRTLQDIWSPWTNTGVVWTPPVGLRVKLGTNIMPGVGARYSVRGFAGAERFNYQETTSINGSGRDEVKLNKVYPMLSAASLTPWADPVLTDAFLTPTGMAVNVAVVPGEPYRLRASTNLQQWDDLASFVATATNQLVVDPAALALPRRFYRAVSP